MKIIRREEAIQRVINGEEVYMFVPIKATTMIEELANAVGYGCLEEEAEKKQKPEKKPETKVKESKKLDHGKIMALHQGGWSVANIAYEMRCSEQTVRNHIAKEEQA